MNVRSETTIDRSAAIREIERLHVTDDVYLRIEKRFSNHLDMMAAGAEASRAFVIAAESGAGKTHTISNLIAAKRFDVTTDEMGERRPLVCITAPAPCTLKSLGLEIYEQMTGECLPVRTLEHDIWRRVRHTARVLGVEVLVIDEMHHLFDAKSDKNIAAVLATLKHLLVGEVPDERRHVSFRPITLVLSGMPTLKDVLARDLQVQRRCIFETIAADDTDAKSRKKQSKFLNLFNARLSEIMGEDQKIDDPEMMARLIEASDSYRGRMCVLLKDAAKMAVMSGSRRIDRVEHLAVTFRERYEVDDANNPFLMADPSRYRRRYPIERDTMTKLIGRRGEPE